MEEKEFLTKEKYEELKRELEYRKGEKRQEILDRIAFAKSLGDLSENAEYHDAKDEQGKNEARITQLEYILKHSVIVEGGDGDQVELGSKVVLFHRGKEVEKEYQIVGKEEADITLGKIGFDSPLGSVLMGKRKGDLVKVETPRGIVEYELRAIS